MKEEVIVKQHLSLENIKTQLNSDINDLLRISTNLQMSPKVSSLSYKNRTFKELPLLVNELYKELSVYMLTNSIIKEINIYFPDNGYIVSTSTAYKDFYIDYMPPRYIPKAYWQHLQETLDPSNFDFIYVEYDKPRLLFSKVLLYNNSRESPLSLIVIEIDINKLLNLLDGFVLSSDFSELTIVNNEKILLSTSQNNTSSWNKSLPYIRDGIDLNLPGLRLISSTNKRMIYKDLFIMIKTLIISIIISLMLGLILTYYNSVRNYRPLDEIITSINDLSGSCDETNEYKKIQTIIRETNKEIESQRSILKNNYIFKLLTGEAQYNQMSSDIAREYDLDFSENQSYVVVMRYSRNKISEQLFPVTTNILRELLEPHFSKLYFCQNQNTIAVIINASDDKKFVLKNGIDSFVAYCGNNFNIEFSAGISELCPNTKLSEAYTQSMNALEYIHLFKKGSVIAYEKIHKESQIGYINLKTFDYLINLVMTGNSRELHAYFTRLKNQYNERELSTDDAKSTLYFFYNVTMHLKAQLQYHYSFKKLAEIFKLNNNFFTFPLSDAISYIESLYKQVIDLISENNNENVAIILQEVSQYIEHNYFDSNLNLNTIATHFGITPSYLSRKYRNLNGYTINDYLYQTRITHALELQEETELKISQIAKMIGFQNSNAFIRIFKRYKGCTPGQYKTSMLIR